MKKKNWLSSTMYKKDGKVIVESTYVSQRERREWEKIDKIFDKHTIRLTKTGNKDFNPPEIISFDVVVMNRYEATKDIQKLLASERTALLREIKKELKKIMTHTHAEFDEENDEWEGKKFIALSDLLKILNKK